MFACRTYLPPIAVALLLLAWLPGCDNTIEPFQEDDAVFSVYGALRMGEAPNLIRVRDVNQPFVGDSTRELDATVTLENLTRGTSETLERSTIAFDGLYFHNFPAHMAIEPEMEYRLTVERSDGASTTSHATAPSITEVEAPSEVAGCMRHVEIIFRDLYNPHLVHLSVGIVYNGERFWTKALAYPGPTEEIYMQFRPQEIINRVLGADADIECEDLDDDRLFMEYYHFGPEWAEYGAPVDPLESLDVEDGLGFFGALREESFTVKVDTTR